jgi:hypothetical protein
MTRLVIEPEAEAELEEAHLVVFILVGDAVSPRVHVLAFMHPRQRPGYWSHRRP